MGIDARMLIRNVPASMVTDEWLKEMSWLLCRSIGAKHFFISDGLPPDEYRAANDAWHAAFNAHPLHAEYKSAQERSRWENRNGPDYDDQTWRRLADQIRADVGPVPDCRRLAIDRTLSHYREEDDPPPGSEYHEDSDRPVVALATECLLEVSLYGRYYGKDYERGDILTYCAIAEWLETNIPHCEVWYGGDSSGVCVERFDEAKRRELRQHLYGASGRAYFSSWCQRDEYGLPPACSLCPGGKYCGERFGSGRDFASFHCAGCGVSHETRDGGETWEKKKER